jgi:hypothetical protein
MNYNGTASFPEGLALNHLPSTHSSEVRMMTHSDEPCHSSQFAVRNMHHRNLQATSPSPIYSESGGAPGRKFFMNVMQQSYGTFLGTNHKSLIQQTCSSCHQRQDCIKEEETEEDLVSAIDKQR